MGNCICARFHTPQQKIKVVAFNGGVEEFSASTTVEEITTGSYVDYMLVHKANPYSPLSPSTELEPGEIYHILPNLVWLSKGLVPLTIPHQEQESGKRQKVRIVVTREELNMLSRKIMTSSVSIGSFGSQECRKMEPSLAMIPEARKF